MRLFHPLGFMLASPAETAEDALSYFENALVEDKYDGVRAQAHCSGESPLFLAHQRRDHRIISRTAGRAGGSGARCHPRRRNRSLELSCCRFRRNWTRASLQRLQQRLGRKKVSEELMRKVPVAYLAFDVFYAGGDLLIDRPLQEREQILDASVGSAGNRTSLARATAGAGPSRIDDDRRIGHSSASRAGIQGFVTTGTRPTFEAAQARGNEGLMIKDPESPYTPGRRGKSWLKLKRELATWTSSSPPSNTATASASAC